jgi:hypothetical protein
MDGFVADGTVRLAINIDGFDQMVQYMVIYKHGWL